MALGWAIAGIGAHADGFMAPAMRMAKNTRLVAVYSRDIGRAQAFATKHGAEHAYDSLDALLKNPAVDAVYVSSPTFLHREQTVAAAGAGKHVLCEKPMALTVAECAAMVEACEKNKVKLGIGFHMRCHPAHVEAKRLVRGGEAGKPFLSTIRFTYGIRGEANVPARTGLQAWRNDPVTVGGGAIMGMGTHLIDLLRFVLGQEITEVAAFADEGTPQMPLDQIFSILVRFEQGTQGWIMCSRLIPDPRNDVDIYGSMCRVSTIGTVGVQLVGHLEVTKGDVSTRHSYPPGNMYVNEIEAFNRCVQENTEPVGSGMDGLHCIQVVQAALQSNRTRQSIAIEAP